MHDIDGSLTTEISDDEDLEIASNLSIQERVQLGIEHLESYFEKWRPNERWFDCVDLSALKMHSIYYCVSAQCNCRVEREDGTLSILKCFEKRFGFDALSSSYEDRTEDVELKALQKEWRRRILLEREMVRTQL